MSATDVFAIGGSMCGAYAAGLVLAHAEGRGRQVALGCALALVALTIGSTVTGCSGTTCAEPPVCPTATAPGFTQERFDACVREQHSITRCLRVDEVR